MPNLCSHGLSVVVKDRCHGEGYRDVDDGGDVPRQRVVDDHVLLQQSLVRAWPIPFENVNEAVQSLRTLKGTYDATRCDEPSQAVSTIAM